MSGAPGVRGGLSVAIPKDDSSMLASHVSPTVRVGALEGLAAAVRAAGINFEDWVLRQGIAPELMSEPDNRLTFRQLVDLLDAAARVTGDGFLGAAIDVKVDADVATITYAVFDPDVALHRHDTEMTLALCVNQWRMHTAMPNWAPTSAHFEHPMPGNDRELRQFFRCPIHFSDSFNGLVVPAAFLETPIRSADRGLHEILSRYAEECLSRHADVSSIVGRARRLIASTLASERVGIEDVAKRLAISPRTLQRRLADEGLQFSDLVDATRRDLAAQYLRDARISLTDTAFLVGYSDLTAFHRAFRRWFNQTPLEFQKQAQKSSA
jgi:AraC-like DNA-binding protein